MTNKYLEKIAKKVPGIEFGWKALTGKNYARAQKVTERASRMHGASSGAATEALSRQVGSKVEMYANRAAAGVVGGATAIGAAGVAAYKKVKNDK